MPIFALMIGPYCWVHFWKDLKSLFPAMRPEMKLGPGGRRRFGLRKYQQQSAISVAIRIENIASEYWSLTGFISALHF